MKPWNLCGVLSCFKEFCIFEHIFASLKHILKHIRNNKTLHNYTQLYNNCTQLMKTSQLCKTCFTTIQCTTKLRKVSQTFYTTLHKYTKFTQLYTTLQHVKHVQTCSKHLHNSNTISHKLYNSLQRLTNICKTSQNSTQLYTIFTKKQPTIHNFTQLYKKDLTKLDNTLQIFTTSYNTFRVCWQSSRQLCDISCLQHSTQLYSTL